MFAEKAGAGRRPAAEDATTSSHFVDTLIAALGGWRGETLACVRALILEAGVDIVEEVKWRKPTNPAGVPVWSHGGLICTGESYANKIKLTFAKGALLDDPAGLFNSGLGGNLRRAVDIGEGARIDGAALQALIRAAAALNTAEG